MKLKPDSRLRKRWYSADSLTHPAKGHIGMWQEIIQRYTEPGQLVLDPMSGIGTSLLAAQMGRNVICVELEQHWVDYMAESWRKVRLEPQLGCQMGEALIIRGDARCLPLGRVDSVATSPPYEGSLDHDAGNKLYQPYRGTNTGLAGSYTRPDAIAPTNIGNLRGQAYWTAMESCYREWHRVLKPGGVMMLVLKGYTRNGQYVDLPQQTADLVETLGFTLTDRWQRELWSLSFWRILEGTGKQVKKAGLQMGLTEEEITEVLEIKRVSNGKLDERLRYEEILAFRREG